VAAVLLLLILGLTFGIWRVSSAQRTNRGRAGGKAVRYRFVAPDDDPDFLRELDLRTRRPDDETS
jgi:hypothetical protein